MTNTHDKLREATTYKEIRALLEAAKCKACCGLGECDDASPHDISFNTWPCRKCKGSGLEVSALSLMQPEIDRRVAEERARLLERLQDPSEGMCKAGYLADDLYPRGQCDTQKELHRCFSEPRWKAMLAAFEQENEDAD